MEQHTVSPEGDAEPATLTLLAQQADSILFDTLDVDEFEELAFYTNADTGELVVTAEDADAFVRLEASETGLSAAEAPEIDPAELEEIEITEPQETPDVDGVQTRRGD